MVSIKLLSNNEKIQQLLIDPIEVANHGRYTYLRYVNI